MSHYEYTIMSEGDCCRRNGWRICLVITCALVIVGSIISMACGVYYNVDTLKTVGCITLAVGITVGMMLIILFNKISECGHSDTTYPESI